MLIRCPTCTSAYDVPADLLGGPGSVIRCAQCRDCWSLAEGYDAPEIVAEARSARHGPPALRFFRAPRRIGLGRGVRRILARAAGAASVLAVLGAGMAGIAFKDRIVRLVPPSAAVFETIGLPVNLRGLALADVRGTLGSETNGSGPVLVLEGRISNLRRVATSVPELRIAVRDKARNELYSWLARAPKPKLDAGETIVFRSRLASPPQDGQEFVVSFADAADGPHPQRNADDRRQADPGPLH